MNKFGIILSEEALEKLKQFKESHKKKGTKNKYPGFHQTVPIERLPDGSIRFRREDPLEANS